MTRPRTRRLVVALRGWIISAPVPQDAIVAWLAELCRDPSPTGLQLAAWALLRDHFDGRHVSALWRGRPSHRFAGLTTRRQLAVGLALLDQALTATEGEPIPSPNGPAEPLDVDQLRPLIADTRARLRAPLLEVLRHGSA